MTSDTPASSDTPARTVAAGYATEGAALELGTVLVDGVCDPQARVRIPLATLNRHGLVAGATGTGKTTTLQALAGQLSDHGVPVLLADVKGDLSGMARPGEPNAKLDARVQDTGDDDWTPTAYPVQFLSLGDGGIAVPVRATITAFGPILLAKVLGLNATQESTLGLIFHWADQRGLPLLDTKDLRAVITHLTSDEGKAELKGIGGVSPATAGVILRALVNLEALGGDTFFGEPEFDPADLMRQIDGKGVVTLLELAERAAQPVLFSTFLMWLLAELYEELPEAGDLDKPKLVFFFDEAHLLFADASKAFLERIEQTVKLIRSKGVGVFFCTQLPTDIPNGVLSQLGARVQHALRAFTPDDQEALTRTVRTYPRSEVYDLESALTSLGTGEAIVTVLSERGAPTPVAWTRLRAPRSLMAAIGDDAVRASAAASPLQATYGEPVDRDSAYEQLTRRIAAGPGEAATPVGSPPPPAEAPPPPAPEESGGFLSKIGEFLSSPTGRQLTNTVTREITRSLFGTRRRR
ncbi:helicase HerA-like domain-containing protein [Pseudonocardia sp. NPDC049635]|uniref:helicase HerA-like domain-containing protein n=1 Tax=Pseudonocardia sp. NPDC049635 TaxID=3155506 RepID=UPI003406F148